MDKPSSTSETESGILDPGQGLSKGPSMMKSRWIAAIAAACALALLVVPWMLHSDAAPGKADTAAEPRKAEGTPANLDLTLQDMNGHAVRLADYKGKIILLNVWATWCGPCQLEIPELIETYAKYKDAPKMQMNYPLLLMQDDFDAAYGPIFGVPVTFFIDRDGTITRRHFGPVSKEQVDREIKSLL
jgi:thiol-disulfide isomerase/thioredoxin